MKTINRLVISAAAVLTLFFTANADVTLKVRQSMGGNTFDATTLMKGKRERSEQDMGGMKMITIRQCDLKRTIRLNPMTEMYIIDSWADDTSLTETSNVTSPSGDSNQVVRKGGLVTITITMRDTGERKKMFGYTARRIISSIESQSSADSCNGASFNKMEREGWYIDADFAIDCGDNTQFEDMREPTRQSSPECRDRVNAKTVGGGKLGFALYEKTTMFDSAGKPSFSMEREVTELSFATLDPALFEAPADWKLAKNDAEMFTGGMMGDPEAMARKMSGGARKSSDPKPSEPTAKPAADSGDSVADRMIGNVRAASDASEKPAGKIRIGLAGVRSGSVGDGVNPEMLAGAIQNLFGDYFVGTGVEIVLLESKLPAALENEAKESSCDFLLIATVSHKRGGGGFGALRSVGNVIARNIPYGGSTAEQIGTDVARTAVYTAGDAAASIKAKDELTLDINLKKLDGSSALTRQFKQKANSERENIMAPVVEKATQAMVEFVTK